MCCKAEWAFSTAFLLLLHLFYSNVLNAIRGIFNLSATADLLSPFSMRRLMSSLAANVKVWRRLTLIVLKSPKMGEIRNTTHMVYNVTLVTGWTVHF